MTTHKLLATLATFTLIACASTQEPAAATAPTGAAADAAEQPPPPDVMRTVHLADVEWKDVPDANGAQMAAMHMDPETKGAAILVKFPAGWVHPTHFHTTNYQYVVLEGDFTMTKEDGTKVTATKGDYVRNYANVVHQSSTTAGAILFSVTEGQFGTVVLNEDGTSEPARGEPGGEPTHVATGDLKWQEVPNAKGVQVSPVYKHATTGSGAIFAKFGPDFTSGDHFHGSSFSRVTVEGDLSVGAKGEEATAGQTQDFFRGIKDEIHHGNSKAGATIFLVSDSEFSTVFVDEAGNPLPDAK